MAMYVLWLAVGDEVHEFKTFDSDLAFLLYNAIPLNDDLVSAKMLRKSFSDCSTSDILLCDQTEHYLSINNL